MGSLVSHVEVKHLPPGMLYMPRWRITNRVRKQLASLLQALSKIKTFDVIYLANEYFETHVHINVVLAL